MILDVCVPVDSHDAQDVRELLETIDQLWSPKHEVNVLVFGESWEHNSFSVLGNELKIESIHISRNVSDARSFRDFESFARLGDRLRSPWVMFLSPRTRVVGNMPDDLEPSKWSGGIAMVRRCELCLLDASGAEPRPNDDSWASDERSLAHVPLATRGHSVSNHAWMGRTPEILAMAAELAVRERLDREARFTAQIGGGAYLNWWAHRYGPTLLGPEYGFFNQCKHGVGYAATVHQRVGAGDEERSS